MTDIQADYNKTVRLATAESVCFRAVLLLTALPNVGEVMTEAVWRHAQNVAEELDRWRTEKRRSE